MTGNVLPMASAPNLQNSPWRTLVEERLDGLSSISEVTLSPSGTEVAFTVSTLSLAANTYVRRIWLADTLGTRPAAPITSGDPGESQPAWSPDGRYLAFVSQRKGDSDSPRPAASLHIMPIHAPGELRRLVERTDAIAAPSWSPDGRFIAYAARVPHDRYSAIDDRGREARRIDGFYTRLDGEGWIYDRPFHMFVAAVDGTSQPRDLTPHDVNSPYRDHDQADFAWIPDSTALVCSAHRHENWDIDLVSDLYLVTLSGEVRKLTDGTGSRGRPSPSPDGTNIAFVGSDDSMTYPQNVKIGVLNLASGSSRWVSHALDRTVETTSGTVRPIWRSDGMLIFSAEDRGTCHVYAVDPNGSSAPTALTTGATWARSWDLNDNGFVIARSTVDHPAELFSITASGEAQLTSLSASFVHRTAPAGWTHFTVPTPSPTPGTIPEIDAWIMCPNGIDPTDDSRPLPVIVNVHGGPHTQYGETYFDEAQMQVAAGFVVIMCNPRGSSGREEAWGQAILGPKHPHHPGTGWGVADLDDVIAVIDAALNRFPVCDPKRLGMQGGSYGGYMATLLAARHEGRLVTVCSERSVNNMLTEEWSSDIGTMFRVEHGPNPVDDPAEYLRMSPITFVRDIDIPMLIIHSENDLRCPISQAEELFVHLRLLDKPVEFWRFPGETHELSRSGSPMHRRQRFEIILEWFAKHLGVEAP